MLRTLFPLPSARMHSCYALSFIGSSFTPLAYSKSEAFRNHCTWLTLDKLNMLHVFIVFHRFHFCSCPFHFLVYTAHHSPNQKITLRRHWAFQIPIQQKYINTEPSSQQKQFFRCLSQLFCSTIFHILFQKSRP